MKGDYRKIKDGHKQTGNNRKKSNKFYEKMNEVMSAKHSVNPPFILDTSVFESSNVTSIDDEVDEIPETDLEDENSVSEKEPKEPSKDGDVTAALVAKEEGSNEEDVKPKLAGSKRKKSAKIDKMEKVTDKMCKKISSQQTESDRVYADLEEKTMKIEHDMLKMQQHMQREQIERAERQRREERDF